MYQKIYKIGLNTKKLYKRNLVAEFLNMNKLLNYINIRPDHPTFYDWQESSQHKLGLVKTLSNSK